jgi:hypothetical protein
MRPLTATELLDVWERGLVEPPFQRALMLIAAASPEAPSEALAGLSVGKRDARLLKLREWTFGPRVNGVEACPACREQLEFAFNLADLRAEATIQLSDSRSNREEEPEGFSVSVGEYEVGFRLPTSSDLCATAGSGEVSAIREVLLQRCISLAQHNGEETSLRQLPSAVTDAVVERMAEADPMADIQLALCCPACSYQWQPVFDIVSFFWSEINAWAYRFLREVHTLASAYGWCEKDVLAMSDWRRQVYLEMISA